MVNKWHVKFTAILLVTLLTACSAVGDGSPGGSTDSGGGGNTSGSTGPGLPAASYRQPMSEITFNGCPPQGDGGDPILNEKKNRVDDGNYQPTDFNTIRTLTWPSEIERRAYDTWSSSAQSQVAQAEGLPVAVQGFLALARQEGPESPNCHSTTDADFHIWLIGQPGGSDARAQAVVVEVTPRIRAHHPQWTVNTLNAIAQTGSQVRISGWLMLDPEHPEQLGKTRGTLWEIHPIMQIEVWQNGQWVALDNGSVARGGDTSSGSDNVSTPTSKSGGVSCPGLNYTCSQLTCEQAYACLAAGNKSLDGNGDGIPCNSQCAK